MTAETQDTAPIPAERFGLDTVARVTVEGTDYVVYSDKGGRGRWACEAGDFDAFTDESDYTEWCQTVCVAIDDRALLAIIAREADLKWVNAGGSGAHVEAKP